MISDEERDAWFAQALALEAHHPEHWLWLSFADPEKPRGQQFLGVVITQAKGLGHAIQKTHALGINPGGEIQAYQVDPANYNPAHFDKLLSFEDLIAAGYIDAEQVTEWRQRVQGGSQPH